MVLCSDSIDKKILAYESYRHFRKCVVSAGWASLAPVWLSPLRLIARLIPKPSHMTTAISAQATMASWCCVLTLLIRRFWPMKVIDISGSAPSALAGPHLLCVAISAQIDSQIEPKATAISVLATMTQWCCVLTLRMRRF